MYPFLSGKLGYSEYCMNACMHVEYLTKDMGADYGISLWRVTPTVHYVFIIANRVCKYS